MPKKERDLLLWIVKNFINSLKPRKLTGELKGTDLFGNKYFELEAGGNRSKNSRYFEPIGKEDGFDREMSPEWESWLRWRRKHPPTEEEVLTNHRIALEKKKKGDEIELKFKGSKDGRVESKLPSDKKSFPVYSEYERAPGDPASKKL